MGIWKKLKKHAALPLLSVSLLTVAWSAVDGYGNRNGGTIELSDLSGDRQELSGMRLLGELTDGYQRTAFAIGREGEATASTRLKPQPEAEEPVRYSPGAPKSIGPYQYTVAELQPVRIAVRLLDDLGLVSNVNLTAALGIRNPKTAGTNSSHWSNPAEYGLAGNAAKLYYTPPVTRDYEGMTGIYEWDTADFRFGKSGGGKDLPAAVVAEWPLVPASEDDAKAMDVIGLEASGDRLALLAVQNGELLIRGYDPARRQPIGELRVPDARIAEASVTPASPSAGTILSERYTAYADSDNRLLTLAFGQNADPEGKRVTRYYTFDLTDGVKLVNETRIIRSDRLEEAYYLIGAGTVAYREGKLYVASPFVDRRDAKTELKHMIYWPKLFLVEVYRGNDPLYEGELLTGLQEDYDFAYPQVDQVQYRHLTNLRFEAEGREAKP